MTNEPSENPKKCSVLHIPWVASEARVLRTSNIGGSGSEVSPDTISQVQEPRDVKNPTSFQL